MPVRELFWDDWNEEHIARHHVSPEDVGDICFGDYWEKQAGGGKRALYGQTSNGRYLLIIGGPSRPWVVLLDFSPGHDPD